MGEADTADLSPVEDRGDDGAGLSDERQPAGQCGQVCEAGIEAGGRAENPHAIGADQAHAVALRRGEQCGAALDQQQHLFAALDIALPAIQRTNTGQQIDTGGQLAFQQRGGQTLGAVRVGAGAKIQADFAHRRLSRGNWGACPRLGRARTQRAGSVPFVPVGPPADRGQGGSRAGLVVDRPYR